jgi:iron complex transport system ATP-binding protein
MKGLDVRSVRFSYPGGSVPVLRDASLVLRPGTVAAILGPNGAGKTTFLDICLGWKKPSAGSVLLGGRPLDEWSRAERGRLLSLVPQRENIRFDFTVLDYVLLGRAPHLGPLEEPGPRDRSVAAGALRRAGIGKLAGRSITTLSGGEYQLMLVARSLAQEAVILLLDEPASQLDPGHQLRVTRLLRGLADRGLAVLLTSHSPQLAAAVADEVHLLSAGRFRHSGTARQALTAESLEEIYGVPFIVRWGKKGFSCSWDREPDPDAEAVDGLRSTRARPAPSSTPRARGATR